MKLPPFPSIKRGLSAGEVNPLLGHCIYHASNQYLTHLFSQVFNHTIIVHSGGFSVIYLCMVFSLSILGSFKFFTPAFLFLENPEALREYGRWEWEMWRRGQEGVGVEKNKELCARGSSWLWASTMSKWKKSRGNQDLGTPITGNSCKPGDPLTTKSAQEG